MDFKQIMDVSENAESMSNIVIYIVAGIAVLLAILVIVWLLFKLFAVIDNKKGKGQRKVEKTEEEELFGE